MTPLVNTVSQNAKKTSLITGIAGAYSALEVTYNSDSYRFQLSNDGNIILFKSTDNWQTWSVERNFTKRIFKDNLFTAPSGISIITQSAWKIYNMVQFRLGIKLTANKSGDWIGGQITSDSYAPLIESFIANDIQAVSFMNSGGKIYIRGSYNADKQFYLWGTYLCDPI